MIWPPGSQRLPGDHHVAEVQLSPARLWASFGDGPLREFGAAPGALVIFPAGEDGRLAWEEQRESVIFGWTRETLRELAGSEFGSGHVELRPPALGAIDRQVLRAAQMLKAELVQREAPNSLYVDSLVTLIGVHLLRHYSTVRRDPLYVPGGLSARSARRIGEYLEANLTAKLSVAELASVAGLPQRCFLRAFAKTFGDPPHRYVIGLRLSFAEALLRTGDLPIVEIARLSGFSSQSHLTSAMRNHRQVTPLQIRRGQ
jgi:AraC family transcriptional regulator